MIASRAPVRCNAGSGWNPEVDPEEQFRRRAAERSLWPVRRFTLGEEPAGPLAQTSASERSAMMWPLALEALIANERASGRLEDLPDVERIEHPEA